MALVRVTMVAEVAVTVEEAATEAKTIRNVEALVEQHLSELHGLDVGAMYNAVVRPALPAAQANERLAHKPARRSN